MAELDYDALQRLADAATPGPWEASEDSNEHLADCPPTMEWLVTATNPGEEFYEEIIDWGNRGRREDAEFIAASRQAIPALLDRVRELEDGRDASDKAFRALKDQTAKSDCERIDLRRERDAALSTITKVREICDEAERIRESNREWTRRLWYASTSTHSRVPNLADVRAALGSVPSTGEGNDA